MAACKAVCNGLLARKDEIAALITKEMGKVLTPPISACAQLCRAGHAAGWGRHEPKIRTQTPAPVRAMMVRVFADNSSVARLQVLPESAEECDGLAKDDYLDLIGKKQPAHPSPPCCAAASISARRFDGSFVGGFSQGQRAGADRERTGRP